MQKKVFTVYTIHYDTYNNETTKFLFKKMIFCISICCFNETNFSQTNRNIKSKEEYFGIQFDSNFEDHGLG